MIAITGAAGFIGSNLAHRLATEGHQLLLVDHELNSAKAANFVGLSQFAFSRHDHFLEDLTASRIEPDAIFHLGACSSTTETNWDYLFRNNVEYTRHLWEWSTAKKKPFLYASSAATYGDGSRGFDDHTPPRELRPLNLYGQSKNAFDIWAVAEAMTNQPTPPKWAGLKFFNVYGPRESHKCRMASVVYHTHRQVKTTGEMKLFRSTDPRYEDGGQRRDFVFVGDCVNHLIWLSKYNAPNGVYNSGSGEARTFHDLARGVFAALGLPPRIGFTEMPSDLAGKYQNFTLAEMTKLRAAGYEVPATTLEDGVRETVQWLEGGTESVRRAA